MNEATMTGFREIADAMAGPEPRDWEWVGPHMSQRMFGITERRATEYAERHGGTARKMEPAGVLADGTIRFWCFAKYGRAYRLSLREGKRGQMPVYHETDECFATGTEAEAECWERNRKAVRRV